MKPVTRELHRPTRIASILCGLLLGASAAQAGGPTTYKVQITDQGFSPKTLTIEPGQRVKLLVHNVRKLPSEFESYSLNREKLAPSGGTIPVWIGPLQPGRYKFFDDFNPGKTGHIVVPNHGKEARQ